MSNPSGEIRLFRTVKPLASTSTPSHWMTVVPQFRPTHDCGSGHFSPQILQSLFWRYASRRRGRWSSDSIGDCPDRERFLTEILSILKPKRSLWIVTPSVSDTLATLNVWSWIDDGMFKATCVVVGGATEIVTLDNGRSRIHWVSSSNYLPLPPDELIRSVGLPVRKSPRTSESGESTLYDPADHCAALHAWFRHAIDLWSDRECGPWRHTASQLAHSLYRRRHATGAVVIHKLKHIHSLERAALHGGRASVFYYGDVNFPEDEKMDARMRPERSAHQIEVGEIYRLDVSSQYPGILASQRIPVSYSHSNRGDRPSDIIESSELYYPVADVLLNTLDAEYPITIPGRHVEIGERDSYWTPYKIRTATQSYTSVIQVEEPSRGTRRVWIPPEVCYPTGTFHTTLCGPELVRACRDGIVVKTGDCAYYRQSKEFAPLAKEMYDWRKGDEWSGDLVGAGWSKLLANAFSGKWAQSSGGWQTDDKICPPIDWGYWHSHDGRTGVLQRHRVIAGVCQTWIPQSDKPRGAPVIFAAITAAGRYQMREIREACPDRSIFQQDTDGLYCSPSAVTALQKAGFLGEHGMGRLRIVSKHRSARFLGPKHYTLDGKWTLAGVASGWIPDGYLTVRDWRRSTWHSLADGKPPETPTLERRSLSLQSLGVRGQGTADGWAVPAHIQPLPPPDPP